MIEETISQQSLVLTRIMECSLLCAPDTSYGSSVRYSLRQVAVVALVFAFSSQCPPLPPGVRRRKKCSSISSPKKCGCRCRYRKRFSENRVVQELMYNDELTAVKWALNSAVECHLHTVEVIGSNPIAPTICFLGLARRPASKSNPQI